MIPPEIKQQINQGKVCPYDLYDTQLVDSGFLYNGQSYGVVYWCPHCGAYVGVHKNSDQALGRLANAELRALKKEAHLYFDSIWKPKVSPSFSKKKARGDAYKWLSEQLNIPIEETHIGMFDEEQCRQVIYLSQQKLSNGPED